MGDKPKPIKSSILYNLLDDASNSSDSSDFPMKKTQHVATMPNLTSSSSAAIKNSKP